MIQKVVSQASGESSKVKVKVRVNIHGVFSVSSASLVEVLKPTEGEEPMETDTTVKEEEVTHIFPTNLIHLSLMSVGFATEIFIMLLNGEGKSVHSLFTHHKFAQLCQLLFFSCFTHFI